MTTYLLLRWPPWSLAPSTASSVVLLLQDRVSKRTHHRHCYTWAPCSNEIGKASILFGLSHLGTASLGRSHHIFAVSCVFRRRMFSASTVSQRQRSSVRPHRPKFFFFFPTSSRQSPRGGDARDNCLIFADGSYLLFHNKFAHFMAMLVSEDLS